MDAKTTSFYKKLAAVSTLALAAQFNVQAAETASETTTASAVTVSTETGAVTINWGDFVLLSRKGYFSAAEIHREHVTGYHKNEDGKTAKTEARVILSPDAIHDALKDNIIDISFPAAPQPKTEEAAPPEKAAPPTVLGTLGAIAGKAWDLTSKVIESPLGFLLVIGGLIVWSTKYMIKKQMGNRTGSIKKSLTPVDPENNKTRFKDVAGADDAKYEVQEVVDFLKNAEKFEKLGAKSPRGILLSGPPGTGKTLLARAVAGEAGVPFYSISGSEFVEVFVGTGAARVRALFDAAKSPQIKKRTLTDKLLFRKQKVEKAAAIIFIDEIDAIGKQRGNGQGGGGNDEREQTLNQILTEMDGFTKDHNIIVLGATNRPELLDKALMRPGRFTRQVTVGLADVKGRSEILKVHTQDKPLSPDLKLTEVARATPSFSGADLANIVNEAAIFCARRNGDKISKVDFREAIDKVVMGLAGKVSTDPEQKALTAYHEAGHVLAMLHEPAAPPLHKVTIVPRGNSGGHAAWLPREEGLQGTVGQMEAHIRIAVAGRVAERLIFGDDKVTGGASADIQSATRTAARMITELGMSKELGMVHYGRTAYGTLDADPETAKTINRLIKDKIDNAEQFMTQVLTRNIDQLHILAHELMEKETLDASEVKALVQMQKIDDPHLAAPGFNHGTGIRHEKLAR